MKEKWKSIEQTNNITGDTVAAVSGEHEARFYVQAHQGREFLKEDVLVGVVGGWWVGGGCVFLHTTKSFFFDIQLCVCVTICATLGREL